MKKRIEWIDVLRGIAMFFVVLGHAFVDRKSIFRKYIYSFHMPLFFFVSGLTFKDKNENILEFLKNKFLKLIVPYFFINVFVFIIKYGLSLFLNVYNNLSIKVAIDALIKAYGNDVPCIQSWFLPCLFLVELLFYIFKKISKNDYILSVLVIATFLLGTKVITYSNEFLTYWHLSTSLIALLFYYLGYMFIKLFKEIKIKHHIITSCIFIPILVLTVYIANYNNYISMNANRYGDIKLFLISSILSIAVFTFISMLIENKDKVFKYVGVHSIFFLAYHSFFLTLVKKYIPVLLSNLPLTIITSIIALVILYPACELVYKKCQIFIGKVK